MCVFRLRSVSALLLSLSLSSVFMFCAKKSGQDAAPPAAAVAPDNVLADARDGKKYKTVKIGEQVWMAENLNYQADGSSCYENSADSCNKYGRLYDWETAKKACPTGWKLPDTADWNRLITAAGGEETAGKKLKSKDGWNDYCDSEDEDARTCFDGNGTDDYGFSAISGGVVICNDGCGVYHVGGRGVWWSANKNDRFGSVYDIAMDNQSENVNNFSNANGDPSEGYSVRCLKE